MLDTFVVFEVVGALSFATVFDAAPGLARGSATAAVLALAGGAVNLPFRSTGPDLLEQWLEPVFR